MSQGDDRPSTVDLAIHELGHAFVAINLGMRVSKVEFFGTPTEVAGHDVTALGVTRYEETNMEMTFIDTDLRCAMIGLGGVLATSEIKPDGPTHSLHDLLSRTNADNGEDTSPTGQLIERIACSIHDTEVGAAVAQTERTARLIHGEQYDRWEHSDRMERMTPIFYICLMTAARLLAVCQPVLTRFAQGIAKQYQPIWDKQDNGVLVLQGEDIHHVNDAMPEHIRVKIKQIRKAASYQSIKRMALADKRMALAAEGRKGGGQ